MVLIARVGPYQPRYFSFSCSSASVVKKNFSSSFNGSFRKLSDVLEFVLKGRAIGDRENREAQNVPYSLSVKKVKVY